jgi:aldehyde:ferredoxin oxidoreductase
MANGYWEKVLRVDLSTGRITAETVGEQVWKECVGGSGFGAKVILEETPAKVDPLSPENRLIFAVGALQAVTFPGNAKWSVCCKGPLTKTWLDTAAGGRFAIRLKGCGYDALILQGKAPKPVYLLITDETVEIRDAEKYWGMDTVEVTKALQAAVDIPSASVVSIGPAGEKMLPIANIAVEAHSFAGRGGSGAVMGSKNLKAVVAAGNKKVEVSDPENAKAFGAQLLARIKVDAEGFRLNGTPSVIVPYEAIGDVPIKYWTGDTWPEGAEKLCPPIYNEILQVEPWNCLDCPIGCHRDVTVETPEKWAMKGPGPEYECTGTMGGSCLVDDVKPVAYANHLCNLAGVDVISAGAFVAFLMECYEKGLITTQDTNGLEIKWGDGDSLVECTRQIVEGKGIGEWFLDGIVGAAKKIGQGSEALIVHVKNMDLPAHDPRAVFGLSVNYATSTRGACHERGDPQSGALGLAYPEWGFPQAPNSTDIEVAPRVAKVWQDASALYDAMSLCKFMVKGATLNWTEIKTFFNYVTGWNWAMEDFVKAAERIMTLQRLINVRDGITRKDDKLPPKMFQPAKVGPRAGKIPVPFEQALDTYYDMRGWDSNGIPTDSKIAELGLEAYQAYR